MLTIYPLQSRQLVFDSSDPNGPKLLASDAFACSTISLATYVAIKGLETFQTSLQILTSGRSARLFTRILVSVSAAVICCFLCWVSAIHDPFEAQ
jgi:hypothetical protein